MQYLLHFFSASCDRVETLLMKHQRGKVSKPRVEQADKEVKSWSPSQAKPSYSDFVVVSPSLDDTICTSLSLSLYFSVIEPFSFLYLHASS